MAGCFLLLFFYFKFVTICSRLMEEFLLLFRYISKR